MILFVSGRCDIPAFYSTWFYNRRNAGFVDVRNPFNNHQISRITLDKETIDYIIFCTKNPIPMLARLDEIKDIPYLFHITLTAYKRDIEEQVANKKDIIAAIKTLSMKLGKDRVIVRYDPILLTDTYTVDYHKRAFDKLCSELCGYIDTIIISFVDMYKNTKANMAKMNLRTMSDEDIYEMAESFSNSASVHHMNIQTCAEEIDLAKFQIYKKPCMGRTEFEKLCGHSLSHIKGKGVRKTCDCMPSVDIGDYNCCSHRCLYCYANYNQTSIQKRMALHDPKSSVLLGQLSELDVITQRADKRREEKLIL